MRIELVVESKKVERGRKVDKSGRSGEFLHQHHIPSCKNHTMHNINLPKEYHKVCLCVSVNYTTLSEEHEKLSS
jgi:hypothetical protein